MSFIQDPLGLLACELWPEAYRFATALGVPVDEATMLDWQLVPTELGAFGDWGYVYDNAASRERSRTKLLIYRQPADPAPGIVYPVRIRIQGFIQRCNLRPLGAWEGEPDRAKAAIQSIQLHPGDLEGSADAWRATVTAIDNLQAYTYSAMGVQGHPLPPIPAGERSLYFQRRVFTKVLNNSTGPDRLRAGDDPYGWAAGVRKDWRVTRLLSMGRLFIDEDGALTASVSAFRSAACDHTAFREGDFVDIGVSVDIAAITKRRTTPRVDVHMTFQHILLLKEDQSEAFQSGGVEVVEQDLVFE
ncbi:hypothetical protein C8R43DRAFT_1133590 [Mycena crocata]|nr:hypothetical protein C8R43DRAFT_1133590 [Mycena crocata]